jgi:hypothetical protein
MQRLLAEPLFYIFLVYGLSFLLLALLVFKGTGGSRSVPLIAAFNMLALFGLTHGITEMTDWVRFIGRTLGAPEAAPLTWLSQICLVLSFAMLLQFALNLFAAQSTSRMMPVVRLIPLVALIVFIAFVVMRGMTDILAIGLLGRYTFGFASAILAAAAMVQTARALSVLGDEGLVRSLYVAAAGFALYAVFGGVIVKPISGIPIQLFRSVCAVTIAIAAFSLIRLSRTVAGGEAVASA